MTIESFYKTRYIREHVCTFSLSSHYPFQHTDKKFVPELIHQLWMRSHHCPQCKHVNRSLIFQIVDEGTIHEPIDRHGSTPRDK